MKWIMGTRLGLYVVYGLLHVVIWKIAGFEFTVIVVLAQVVAELHRMERNKEVEENRKN